MFDNEEQFEELVKKLKIDDSIDSSHKAKLRAKVLASHSGSSKPARWRLKVLSIAAMVLICLAIGRIAFYHPQPQMQPQVAKMESSVAMDSPVVLKESRPVSFDDAKNMPIPRPRRSRPKVKAISEYDYRLADANEPKFVKAIRKMADEGDVAGLVAMAKGPKSPAKFLAVKFLTDIFDANAVEIFEALQGDLAITDQNSPFYQDEIEPEEIVLIDANEANDTNTAPEVADTNDVNDA